MTNTGLIKGSSLNFLDSIVYNPKTAPLIADQIFTSIQIPSVMREYHFLVRDGNAIAKEYTNRMTDIPDVDEGVTEYAVPITSNVLALSYSEDELEEAAAFGIDLLADKAGLVNRGLAERKDKIIFNGLESKKIIGLTNTNTDKTGFQQINAEQTFAAMATDTEEGAIKLRNFFKDAIGKITHLVGYADAKPTLLLPQSEIDELERPFNKYNPQMTVRAMIEPWLSNIIAVPELEGEYWHAKNAHLADKDKDMGILCLTTPDIAQIPVAYKVSRQRVEYSDMVTTIPYKEKHGGLAVRYPSAFVQLLNIN